MQNSTDSDKLKNIFAKNLRQNMEKRSVNTADLARALSLSFTTVSDWVHGRKYPRMDKVQALADFFGIMKSELTEDKMPLSAGLEPIDLSKYHKIPILGRISAGLPIYAEENIEGYTLTDLNGGAEYFGLRVSGDSMNAARINDGDIVIVRRQEEVESGQVAVVLVDGDNATVKRFYSTSSTVTLMPQSTNPIHQPQIYDLQTTDIKILGRVIKVEFTL